MYVEKDTSGRVIIQDINPEEAGQLVDCIRSYLSTRPLEGRTDMERKLIFLKAELEKTYSHGLKTIQA